MQRIPDNWEQYTLDDIENMIKKMPKPITDSLRSNGILNSDKLDLPLFTEVFDRLCGLLGYFPSQDMYAGYYMSFLTDEHIDFYTSEIYKRARRAYLSLIREYHAYYLIRNYYPHHKIIFDLEYDREGVDFLLLLNGQEEKKLGLQLTIATFKNRFIGKKQEAYHNKPFPVIMLPLAIGTARIVNGYWLYDKKHIDILENF